MPVIIIMQNSQNIADYSSSYGWATRSGYGENQVVLRQSWAEKRKPAGYDQFKAVRYHL